MLLSLQTLASAYAVLSNDELRKRYDSCGSVATGGPPYQSTVHGELRCQAVLVLHMGCDGKTQG